MSHKFIFDLSDDNDNGDLDIITKITNGKTTYLYDCFKRLKATDTENAEELKTFSMYNQLYVTGEFTEKPLFEEYIADIPLTNGELWNNFVENNDVADVSPLFEQLLKFAKKHKNGLKILELGCKPKKCLELIKSFPVYSNGIDSAEKSFISYFYPQDKITLHGWRETIEGIYNAQKYIWEDESTTHVILNNINKILVQNTAYTYHELDNDINDTYQCSDFNFLFYLLGIILMKWIDTSNKTQIQATNMRSYKFNDADSVAVKVMCLYLHVVHICYHSARVRVLYYEDDIKQIDQQVMLHNREQIMANIKLPILYKQKQIIMKKLSIMRFITTNQDLNSSISDLYCLVTELVMNKKMSIFDELSTNIIQFYSHLHNSLQHNIPATILQFYTKLISSNDFTKNPGIKLMYTNSLISLNDCELDKKVVVMSLIKYYNSNNLYEQFANQYEGYLHHMKLCEYILKNLKDEELNEQDVQHFVHKLLFKISASSQYFFDKVMTYIQQKMMTGAKISTKRFDSTLQLELALYMSSYKVINFLLKKQCVQNIGQEIINIVVLTTVKLLEYFSNDMSPLYIFFDRGSLCKQIMNQLFTCIMIFKDDERLSNTIAEFRDTLSAAVEFLKPDKDSYDQKFGDFVNITNNNNDMTNLTVPYEFCDPLLCHPIRVPIMIPSINSIFDRSSIMTQLYIEPINPYTKDPLTIEILDEYNKKDDVIQKINKFTVEFDAWKKDNMKSRTEKSAS